MKSNRVYALYIGLPNYPISKTYINTLLFRPPCIPSYDEGGNVQWFCKPLAFIISSYTPSPWQGCIQGFPGGGDAISLPASLSGIMYMPRLLAPSSVTCYSFCLSVSLALSYSIFPISLSACLFLSLSLILISFSLFLTFILSCMFTLLASLVSFPRGSDPGLSTNISGSEALVTSNKR